MALGEIQTALNGGEISPKLYARTDLAKFEAGAALLRNFIVDFRGGVTNRAGTQFIAACKDVTGQKRLIPFIVSTDAAFVLEFGNLYIRVYLLGELVAEVVTPYIEADLVLLKYTQSADVLTLVHPSYPPANLSRTSDVGFSYDLISVGPGIDAPVIPALASSMVAPHSGPYSFGYLITAVDLDGKEESLGSNPGVKHSEGMNETTNRVIGLTWTPPAQAVSRYNVYKWGPIDAVTMNPATVWGFIGTAQTNTFTDNNIAPDFSKQPPGWGDPFSGGQIQSIVVVNGGSGYNGVSGDWPTAIPYVPLVITGDGTGAAGYAVIDHATAKIVGAYLTNPGKNYTNATVTANGQSGTGATFAVTFSDLAPLYPACTAYVQQRRVFAGSDPKPETLVLSQIGRYNNFNTTPVSLATDAIPFSIAGEQVNSIKSMVGVSYGLLLFTTSEVQLLNGGSPYASITTESVSVQSQSSVGANDLQPLRVNADVLYTQNKGNRVRNLAFAWQKQAFQGSDISALAAHLFDGFLTTEWTWAEEPFKVAWLVRDDGHMVSLTYAPDQEVAAWCRHDTQGLFKSVCSVPEGDTNAVYVIVERHVPNASGDPCWVQYIERFAERANCCIFDSWFLDSGVALDRPLGQTPLYISPGVGAAVTINTYDPCSGTPTGDFGGQGSAPTVVGIQNFDLTGLTGGNYRDDICSVDWDNGHLYIHSAANGLIQVDDINTFGVVVPGLATSTYQYCMTVGEDGFVYYAGGAGPNCTALHKAGLLTPTTDIAVFGTSGGPFNFTTDFTHWSVPADMDVVVTHTGKFMVSVASLGFDTGNEVPVINLSTMQWTGFSFSMDEQGAAVTRGSKTGANTGIAYTIGLKRNGNATGAGLYSINCTFLSGRKIAYTPASAFGTGFTHLDRIVGLIYDETDGNLITHVACDGLLGWVIGNTYVAGDMRANAGHDYLSLQNGNIGHTPASSPTFWQDLGPTVTGSSIVKLKASDGSVMWSVPIGAPPSTGSSNYNCSRIRHGIYCYMSPSSLAGVRSLTAINTITGAFTRTTETGVFADVGYYNDETGQTIFSTTYSDPGAGLIPRPIGATPSSFVSWASLGKANGFPASNPPTIVGQVVQVECGKILVTAQASATQASGTIIAPLDLDLPDDPDGMLIPISTGAWSITQPTATISGLTHLEGKVVWALADGVVHGPLTVVGGAVTLPAAVSNAVVGLKYTQQIQTLYLTMDDLQRGSIQGKRKLVPATTLRLDCTKGIKVGQDFDNLTEVPDCGDIDANFVGLNPGELFAGDAYIVMGAAWDEKGEICIQQDLPLPASVLGIIVQVVPGDTGS